MNKSLIKPGLSKEISLILGPNCLEFRANSNDTLILDTFLVNAGEFGFLLLLKKSSDVVRFFFFSLPVLSINKL